MSFTLAFAFLLLQSLTLAQDSSYPNCVIPSSTCNVYGVDFQDGGSYFQNQNSTEDFSFVQQFTGCDVDYSYNLIVDPDGDQSFCDETDLTPDSVNRVSNCPIAKADLISGAWSILVISNNGNCAPIGYERDFNLVVGTQSTSTYTPTVTFSDTSTPITTSTSTVLTTTTQTLPPSTTTLPKSIVTSTKTVRVAGPTVTQTMPRSTKTLTTYTFTVVPTTITATAKCHAVAKATTPDASLQIVPTLAPVSSIVTELSLAASATPAVKRRFQRWSGAEKASFVKRRSEKLAARAVGKRSPDQSVVTVTDLNTADFVTSRTTVLASAVTLISTIEATVTVTTAPPPETVYKGGSKTVITVTQTGTAKTRTLYPKPTSILITGTKTSTPRVTVTTTPQAAITKCEQNGGLLY